MEKIVIVCGPEGPDEVLLSRIGIVFPECEIEIKPKAFIGKQVPGRPSHDSEAPHGKVSKKSPPQNL